MLKVLINAYAVRPGSGSEPGMGWNWVVNLARYCRVFVITEGEWRHEIEDALAMLPCRDNIRFYYLPVSDKVRSMCWNQGDWRFYWYYRKWQKRALDKAEEIISQEAVDVIHQLNMIGFREPGYLWKIKDLPYVWGPVGGMGDIPVSYLKGSGWKQSMFCRLKNFISNLQIKYSRRVREAASRGTMIAAIKEVKEKVSKYYGMDIPLINETGCYPSESLQRENTRCDKDKFTILWVGKFDFRKQLSLALKTLALLKQYNVELIVCGDGNPRQKAKYRRLAHALQVDDRVKWMGQVENHTVKELMSTSDLFLFTSIMEATSTVVLEAIESGLPVLSFDTCGFGPIVSEFAGVTIPLSTPDDSCRRFADEIDNFIKHKDLLAQISEAQKHNRHKLFWDNKARVVRDLYDKR